MIIKQFEYKPLAHYSYAILSEGKMALVDPERDLEKYYAFAEENKARITAIFETHPHADFISGHLQLHKETGANIYVSALTGADYPHKSFDDGDHFKMGKITFEAINTPGHSPDSISIIAKNTDKTVLFTGDTLFIGDVGRPDLRENNGNKKATRQQLAKAMYHSIQNKFANLPDDALLYPAHGAGSLCGNNMSSDSSSTLGNERQANWAFAEQSETDFVNRLLESQPFVPHYFGFDVDLNKAGAPNFHESIGKIPLKVGFTPEKPDILVIDTRQESVFKANHLPHSINIMAHNPRVSFETWLGAIVEQLEPFYLVGESVEQLKKVVKRVARIGYEKQIEALITLPYTSLKKQEKPDAEAFKRLMENYTIVDIRNRPEAKSTPIFKNSMHIPLNELRERLDEIPREKPIMVHCAGGYRSAAGSSIIAGSIKTVPVYDLGEAVKDFH